MAEKTKANKLNIGNKLISKLLDVKLFGGMIPEEARLIGSIQFEWANSLHPIHIERVTVSSAFASNEEKTKGSFGSRYVIPYALYTSGAIYSPTRNQSLNEASGNSKNDHLLTLDEYTLFENSLKYGTLHARSGVKGFIEPIMILKVVKDSTAINRYDSLSDEIVVNQLSKNYPISHKDLSIDLIPLRRILELKRKNEYNRVEVFVSDSGKRKYTDLKNISKKYSDFTVLDGDLDCTIEYVFIYEVKNSNPNGNPDLDNMPRQWEGTDIGIISPERQKRWVRDYIEEHDEMILISRKSKALKAKDRLKEIESILKSK